MVGRSLCGFLLNCAKNRESLAYVRDTEIIQIMATYKNQMIGEPSPDRIEFLSYYAFLLAYIVDEFQLHMLEVHRNLISYLVKCINEALEDDNHYCAHELASLSELCDGLAQLARYWDTSAAILKIPKSVKHVTSVLESDDEIERKAALHLIHRLCQSKQNKDKIKTHKKLLDRLDNMRLSDPIRDFRKISERLHQDLISLPKTSLLDVLKRQ
ncbi:unnamed protein product [Clavelina lepadiformis]|uniref:Uncharacterized protein n=1 Tax=Clavelina lepadiformis TaxID=159417 RepID=A0ABP0FUA2_CLALP